MGRASTSSCSSCRATESENRLLRRHLERLEGENEQLREKIAVLETALERARRDGKRQAAPFSKGKPTENPRRPGRRSGKNHGAVIGDPTVGWDNHLVSRIQVQGGDGAEISP